MTKDPTAAEGPDCLQDENFAAWQANALSDVEREQAVAHTAQCPRCRALLGELVRTETGDDDSRIGRYEILETLGSGGMGVVLRAYDPLLGREVAVKVCRQRAGEEIERQALLEEARKLAQVRHQNVVPVYDVGLEDDEIYIAMELVDGESLAEWTVGEERPLSERFSIARGIGLGLTAIHEAGLVHRDLKPANVMVRGDGSAVIVDLGLAERHGPRSGPAPRPAGTRGFLPPEVEAGAVATPRSDQYQWWALSKDPLALENDLPWMLALQTRGLAREPSERFDSVRSGLDAIEQASEQASTPRRSRALLVGAIATAAIAVIAALVVFWQWPSAETKALGNDDCEAKVGWKPETKAAVLANLLENNLPAKEVVDFIDRRATRAQSLSKKLCYAAREGEDKLAWRRRECVLSAWRDTSAEIPILRDGDGAASVEAIDELATHLPLERCDRGTVLAVPAPLSAEAERKAQDARKEILAAVADPKMSSRDKKAQLVELEAELTPLGPIVMAQYQYELGRVYATQANDTEAVAAYAAAYRLATHAGADELATAALVMQVNMMPKDTSADAAKQLEEHARAAVERLGSPYWSAQLDRAVATFAMDRGDYKKAIPGFRNAIESLRSMRLQPHEMELSMMQNLGAALLESGDAKGAEEVLSQAVTFAAARWEPHRPDYYWTIRGAHATSLLASGRVEEAAAALSEVASGLDKIGAATYQQGMIQSYLGASLVMLKRFDDARLAADRAVDLVAKDAGESSVLVWPLISAAQIALKQSEPSGAKKGLLRAQAICKSKSCREIEITVLDAYLAIALKRTGDARAGKAIARRVRAKLEAPGFEQARHDVANEFPKLGLQ